MKCRSQNKNDLKPTLIYTIHILWSLTPGAAVCCGCVSSLFAAVDRGCVFEAAGGGGCKAASSGASAAATFCFGARTGVFSSSVSPQAPPAAVEAMAASSRSGISGAGFSCSGRYPSAAAAADTALFKAVTGVARTSPGRSSSPLGWEQEESGLSRYS